MKISTNVGYLLLGFLLLVSCRDSPTIETLKVDTKNIKVYKNTGKLVEKYNVVDMSLEAGGGEYPVQDGFGWTNGVLLRLLSEDKI